MSKLALLAIVLGACGTSSSDSSTMTALRNEQPVIDRLQFDTASSIPQNAPPDVSVTVTDQAARDVYAATLALPELPPGGYNCPADAGIYYTFAFYSADTEVVTGTVQPAGCELATLSVTVGTASLSLDNDYWGTLAADLGIPESKIYPYTPN